MKLALGALIALSAFAQTSALLPVPRQQPLNNTGDINVGGCVYTYSAGTNTPQTTYSNSGLTVANTNPIVLDGSGRMPPVFWNGTAIKVVYANKSSGSCPGSPGTTLWSQDNVTDAAMILKTALASGTGATMIGYTPGIGSQTTVAAALNAIQANNIVNYGADPTGVANSASAIANALAASNNVTASCGTYNIGSTSPAVTIPAGVNFTPPECAKFKYSGSGVAFLITGGASQMVSLRVERTTIGWTGADASSIGVKVDSTINSQFPFLLISNFNQGLLLTTTTTDTTGNKFGFIDMEDNKVGVHLQPSGGYGTNQNTFEAGKVRINSGAQCPATPIAGTRYIWHDVGSNNFNAWFNINIENECPEFSAYVDGGPNFFYTPRLEGNNTAAFTLTANSTGSWVQNPYSGSGKYRGEEINDVAGKNFIVGQWGYFGPALVNGANPYFRLVDFSNNVIYDVNQGRIMAVDGIWTGAGSPCVPTISGATGKGCFKGNVETSGAVVAADSVTAGSTMTATGKITGAYYACTGAAPAISSGFGTGPVIVGDYCGGKITAGTGVGVVSARLDFGAAAPNGLVCSLQNITTQAVIPQTVTDTTQCNFKAGLINDGDVLVYTARPY